MFILARALQQLGEQSGQRNHLIQSVHYYREIVDKGILSKIPTYELAVPNNFGVALARLERPRQTPPIWRKPWRFFEIHLIQQLCANNSPFNGPAAEQSWNALLKMGERESGIEKLREAEQAYRAALSEWRKDRFPLDWAALQSNIGTSFRWLEVEKVATTVYLLQSLPIEAR